MKKLIVAAILASAVTAMPADAALLQFTFTGSYNASFRLDSNPTPDDVDAGYTFTIYDVAGTFPGTAGNVADLTFYNGAIGGGFDIYDAFGGAALVNAGGAQLYTGSEASPIFRTGTFALAQVGDVGRYTLTITNLAAAVPEPATWSLMLAGFGMVGAGLRMRRRSTAFSAA